MDIHKTINDPLRDMFYNWAWANAETKNEGPQPMFCLITSTCSLISEKELSVIIWSFSNVNE